MGCALIEKRLRRIADWCAPYRRVVEIGAAQGRLSRFLYDRGHKVAATEVNASQARILRQWIYPAEIPVWTGFGLEAIAGVFDLVVIAGIGGATIASILRDWRKVPGHPIYIVQPMQAWERLRSFIYAENFSVVRADLMAERDRFYPIWMLYPPGTDGGLLLHPEIPSEFRHSPLYGEWLNRILAHRRPLAAWRNDSDEWGRLLRMEEELQTWDSPNVRNGSDPISSQQNH